MPPRSRTEDSLSARFIATFVTGRTLSATRRQTRLPFERERASLYTRAAIFFYVGGQSSRTPEDRREPRLVIEDAGRRKRIVASLHDSSHLGVNRTLDLVTEKYYWPGLTAAVKDYVSDFDHNY